MFYITKYVFLYSLCNEYYVLVVQNWLGAKKESIYVLLLLYRNNNVKLCKNLGNQVFCQQSNSLYDWNNSIYLEKITQKDSKRFYYKLGNDAGKYSKHLGCHSL